MYTIRGWHMSQRISEHLLSRTFSTIKKYRECNVHDRARQKKDRSGVGFLFFLLCGCYIPIILLWAGILPFAYRFYALFAVLVVYTVALVLRGYRFRELGFTTAHLGKSIRWNLIACIAGAFCLFLVYKSGLFQLRQERSLPYVYAGYILFLAPVQELIFRGILFAEMKRIHIADPRWILLVSSLSFCFLHVIYGHLPLLIISFASGLMWGGIYLKWPNIWGVSFSHAFLGTVALFLGMI
jgi:membrane protease YdiL (CAAX protease family)